MQFTILWSICVKILFLCDFKIVVEVRLIFLTISIFRCFMSCNEVLGQNEGDLFDFLPPEGALEGPGREKLVFKG